MKEKIAIIGAGASGLCCAKSAIENNLEPVVFDKSDNPGGLWIPKRTAWESMRINSSNYFTSFIDFPWPDDSDMFPTSFDLYQYILDYIKLNSLEKFLKLNTLVEKISKTNSDSWNITYTDLKTNKRISEEFKFIAIATGINNKPIIPNIKNLNLFKGKIVHSSNYRSNDDSYTSKNILVVGCSTSAVEIAADLAKKSKSVTNIFTRAYLILKKLIKTESKSASNCFNLIPIDFLFFNRKFAYELNNMTEENRIKFLYENFKKLCPHQLEENNTNKNLDDLKFDLFGDITRSAVSEDYIDLVLGGKIKAKKAKIVEFKQDGVVLDNGEFLLADVVVFGTGFQIGLEFFDDDVLAKLKFKQNMNKDPIILFENTWHPELKNIGFIGLARGFYFPGAELQSKWICKVFNGEMSLPTKQDMIEELNKCEQNRKNNEYLNLQYPYGNYVILADKLAKKLNLLPDFDSIKKSNYKLYEMLWNNGCLPFHYMFNTNYEKCLELLIKVDKLTKRNYFIEQLKNINITNFKY